MLSMKSSLDSHDYALTDELTDLNQFISSSDIISQSTALTIALNSTQRGVTITTPVITVSSSGSSSDEYTEYCFNGLMYDNTSGTFYVGPSRMDTFIPILHADKFFNALIKQELKRDTNIENVALDKFFQNHKMANGKLNDLMSTMINSTSVSTRGATKLESLLSGYASVKPTDSKVKPFKTSLPKAEKFMAVASKLLMNYTVRVIRAFSGLSTSGRGPMNTLISISQSARPVIDSPVFTDKIMPLIDRADHGLVKEMSTNPIFNPTSRTFLNDVIDPGTKNMFTKRRSVRSDYNNLMKVMNAQDLSHDDRTSIFNVALGTTYTNQIVKDITNNTSNLYSSDSKVLARASEVQLAAETLKSQVLNRDDSAITSSLAAMGDDDYAVSPILTGILSSKNIRLLTSFMIKGGGGSIV